MFTTGSKLFLGLAVLAGRSLAVLGWATGWEMQATVGAASACCSPWPSSPAWCSPCATTTPIPLAHRAARRPRGRRRRHGTPRWSVAAGFGAAARRPSARPLDSASFIAGLVVVGLAALEWVVQSWSDRASADPAFNDRLRGRIMIRCEFPVAGLLCGGLIVFGFSPADGRAVDGRCDRRVRGTRRGRDGVAVLPRAPDRR